MQVACMREKTPPLCRMRFPGQEFASQQGLGPTRMQVLPPRHLQVHVYSWISV